MLLFSFAVQAQKDSSFTIKNQFPGKVIDAVNSKLSGIDRKISRQTAKTLRRFQRQQTKLEQNRTIKDSLITSEAGSQKLQQLQQEFFTEPGKIVSRQQEEYNAYIDTLRTTISFLQEKGNIQDMSNGLKDKLAQATAKLDRLEAKLKKADEIKNHLKERKEYLKQQLERSGMVKQLKRMEKTAYYYNEYIKEYKSLLKDKKRAEQKAMALLYSIPAFKRFIEKNSLLANIFKIPGPAADNLPVLPGLQTRTGVQQLIQDRVTTGGPNAITQVRQQIQSAQGELNKLKENISKYGTPGSDLPGFSPNSQKTKSLFKRLTYEANIQFSRSNKFLPTQSDMAFGVGYKLNDNGVIGIASSIKIGLGTGWDDIRLSTQGLSLRSYLDWKVKGNFYVSGGYEKNYYSRVNAYPAWQSSALIGISKKYQVNRKLKGKLQLLYDPLANQHIPKSNLIVFRFGYSIK